MIRIIKGFIYNRINGSYWGRIEKKYGVNIQTIINSGDRHRGNYGFTPVRHLKFFERYLRKAEITADDSIIDVGCGVGGMLFYFSRYPFKKISGLEYSRELAERCLDNLSKWGGRDVQVIIDDAVRFDDYDEYNYFYLANPFDDVIMKDFLRHLDASIARKPRLVTVLYANCIHKDMFLEDGFRIAAYYKKNFFHTRESIVLRKK